MSQKQNLKSQNQNQKEESKMATVESTIDVGAVVAEAAPTPKKRGRRKGVKVERKSRKLPLPVVPEGGFEGPQTFDPTTHSMFASDKFSAVFKDVLDGWKTLVSYRQSQVAKAQEKVESLAKLGSAESRKVMSSLDAEIDNLGSKVKALKADNNISDVRSAIQAKLEAMQAMLLGLSE